MWRYQHRMMPQRKKANADQSMKDPIESTTHKLIGPTGLRRSEKPFRGCNGDYNDQRTQSISKVCNLPQDLYLLSFETLTRSSKVGRDLDRKEKPGWADRFTFQPSEKVRFRVKGVADLHFRRAGHVDRDLLLDALCQCGALVPEPRQPPTAIRGTGTGPAPRPMTQPPLAERPLSASEQHAPKAMIEGDITVGLIVDEHASDEQTQAIAAIASGEAGGPMAALTPLVAKIAGIEKRPIRFEGNGMKYSVTAGELLDEACEGVASAANPDEPMHIDNTMHPVNPKLALARASHSHMHAFGIDWDDSSGTRNGHFAPLSWAG